MPIRTLASVCLVPALILLVPFVAMQFTDEVAWTPRDFALAWSLMAGVGLTYKVATRRTQTPSYRGAIAVALGAAFILVWANGAVGIIGSEDNPANVLYRGVLAVGLVGAVIARFEARGMAWAMFGTAAAQLIVPGIALIRWNIPFGVELVVVNAFFALLFVGSGLLFLRSAREPNRLATPV